MCGHSFGIGTYDICYVFHMTWERHLGTLRSCESSHSYVERFVHVEQLADDQGDCVALTFKHKCSLCVKFCALLTNSLHIESHRRVTQAQYVIYDMLSPTKW